MKAWMKYAAHGMKRNKIRGKGEEKYQWIEGKNHSTKM